MDFHLAILSVTPWSSAPVRSNYLHNAKMFKRQVASTVPWRGMSRVRASAGMLPTQTAMDP